MNKPLVGVVVTMLAAILLVPLGAAPVAASSGAETFVTAFSDQAEYVGDGTNHLWLGTSQVSVSRPGCCARSADSAVIVNVSSGGDDPESLLLFFGAPDDRALTTGTYVGANGDASTDRPDMAVEGSLLGYSSERDCNTLTGTFRVRDIAPDLSRLWITYEQHCFGMPEALYGEIRYQEPGGDGDLLVAPGQVAWPASYPGVPAHEVPVTLVNTGASPVQVSGASVTDGGSEFSVSHSSCGTIAPGASCVVTMTYVPEVGGRHQGQLTVQDSTTAGVHVVPLSGGIHPGHTSWQMHSQQGDYIGGGRDHDLSPANAVIWARADHDTIAMDVVAADNGDWDWDVQFAAPPGQVLRPGTTYTGAMRAAFRDPGRPGLDANGQGRGCDEVSGSFHLRELTVDQGYVTSFAATFVQNCESGEPQLTGSIAWHADSPADPLPVGTRMTPHITVSPGTTVTDGGSTRFSGRLWRGPIYNGLNDKRVLAYARPQGSARWTAVASAVTRGNGDYSLRVASHRTTDYLLRFVGDRDHLPVSAPVAVLARWRVGLREIGNVRRGKARLVAQVQHGRRGQVVVLQRWGNRTWTTVGRKRLSKRATAVFTVRRPARDRKQYRVAARPGDGHIAGGSEAVDVLPRSRR